MGFSSVVGMIKRANHQNWGKEKMTEGKKVKPGEKVHV